MDSNKVTSVLGGVYGVDQLEPAVSAFMAEPGLRTGFHVLGVLALIGWAWYTNKA